MEANGRFILPPKESSFNINELWFIQRNLSKNPTEKEFQTCVGLSRIYEQMRTKNCVFHQVNQNTLNNMVIAQYPHMDIKSISSQ